MSIVQKQQLSHVTNHLQKVLYLHFHMKIMPLLYPCQRVRTGVYIFFAIYIFLHIFVFFSLFFGSRFSLLLIFSVLYSLFCNPLSIPLLRGLNVILQYRNDSFILGGYIKIVNMHSFSNDDYCCCLN